MLPVEAGQLGVEIMNSARRWVQRRAVLRRTLDSKSASPKQVETRKKEYEQACRDLEAIVLRLERLLVTSGKAIPMTIKSKSSFPWQNLFSMIAAGAKAAEQAVTAPTVNTPTFIDVEAKTMEPGDK